MGHTQVMGGKKRERFYMAGWPCGDYSDEWASRPKCSWRAFNRGDMSRFLFLKVALIALWMIDCNSRFECGDQSGKR